MHRLVAFGFVLGFGVLSAPALAATPEEEQACTPDAYRLCEHLIPDAERVKACLIAKMRRLSPACRRAIQLSLRRR